MLGALDDTICAIATPPGEGGIVIATRDRVTTSDGRDLASLRRVAAGDGIGIATRDRVTTGDSE